MGNLQPLLTFEFIGHLLKNFNNHFLFNHTHFQHDEIVNKENFLEIF